MSNGDRVLNEPADERDEKDLSTKEGGKATGNPGEKGSGTSAKGQAKIDWLEELDEILGTSFAANNAKGKKDAATESKPNEKSAGAKTTVADKANSEPSQVKQESNLANSLVLTPLFSESRTAIEPKQVSELPAMGGWRERVAESLIGQVPAAAPTPPTAAEMRDLFPADFPFNKPNLGVGKLEVAELIQLEELVRNNRLNGTPLNNFRTKSGTDLNAADQIQLLNEAIYSSLHDKVEALTLKASSDNVSKTEYVPDSNGNDTSEIKMIYFQDGKAGSGIGTHSKILAEGNYKYIISAYLRARKAVNPSDGLDQQLKNIADERAKAKLTAGSAAGGGTTTKSEPTDYKTLATFLSDHNGIDDAPTAKSIARVYIDTAVQNVKADFDKTGNVIRLRAALEKEKEDLLVSLKNSGLKPEPLKLVAKTVDGILTTVDGEPNNPLLPLAKMSAFVGGRPIDISAPVRGPSVSDFVKSLNDKTVEADVRGFLSGKIGTFRDLKATDATVLAEFRTTFLTTEKANLDKALDGITDAALQKRAKDALQAAVDDYKAGDTRSPEDYQRDLNNSSLKSDAELILELSDITRTRNPEEAEKKVRAYIGDKARKEYRADLKTTDATKKGDFKTAFELEVDRLRGVIAAVPDTKIGAAIKTAAKAACDDAKTYNPGSNITPGDFLDKYTGTLRPVEPEKPWDPVGWIGPNFQPWNNLWSVPKDVVWGAVINAAIELTWRKNPNHESRIARFVGTLQKNHTIAGFQRDWFVAAANRAARNTPISDNGQPVHPITNPGLDPTNPSHYSRVERVYRQELSRRVAQNRIGDRAMRMIDPPAALRDPNNPSVFDRIPRDRFTDAQAITDIHTNRTIPGGGVIPSITRLIATEPDFTGRITHAKHLEIAQRLQGLAANVHLPDARRLRAFELYIDRLAKRAQKEPDELAIWDIHTDRGHMAIDETAARALIPSVGGTAGIAETLSTAGAFSGKTTNAEYAEMVKRAYAQETNSHNPDILRAAALRYYGVDVARRAEREPDKLAIYGIRTDQGLPRIQDAAARVLIRNGTPPGIAQDIANSAQFTGRTTNGEYLEMVRRAQEAELNSHPINAERIKAFELYLQDIQARPAGEPALQQVHIDRTNTRVDDVAATALIRDNSGTGIAETMFNSPLFTGRTTNSQYLDMVRRAQDLELSGNPDPTRARAFELYIKRLSSRTDLAPGDPAVQFVHTDRGLPTIQDINARALIPSISSVIPVDGKTTNGQYLAAVRRAQDIQLTTHPINPERIRAYELYVQDISSPNRPAGDPCLNHVVMDRGLAGAQDGTARALIPTISNAIGIDGRTTNAEYLEMVRHAQETALSGSTDNNLARAYALHIADIERRNPGQPAALAVTIDRGGAAVQDGAARALITGTGGIANSIYSSPNFNGRTTNGQYLKLVRTAYESELTTVPPNAERLRAFELYLNDIAPRNAGQPALFDVAADSGVPAVQDNAARDLIADNGLTDGIASDIANSPEFTGRTTNGEYLRLVRRAQEAELTASPLNLERIRAYELYVQDISSRTTGEPALFNVHTDRGSPAVQEGAARAEIPAISNLIPVDGRTTNAEYLRLVRRAQANELSGPADPALAKAYELYIQDLSTRPAGEPALLNVVTDRGLAGATDADARIQIGGISSAIAIDGRTTNAQYLELLRRAQATEASSGADATRMRAFELHIQEVSRRTADRPAFYDVIVDRGQARVQDTTARNLITGIANTIYSSPNFDGNTTNGQYLKAVRTAYESESTSVPPRAERLRAFELYMQDLASRNAGQPAIFGVAIDSGVPPVQDITARALIADNGQHGIASSIANSPEFNGKTTNGEYLKLVRRAQEAELTTRPLNPERIRAYELYIQEISGRLPGEPALFNVCVDSGMPAVHDAEARAEIKGIADTISINGKTTNAEYLRLVRRAQGIELSGHPDPVLAKAYELYIQDLSARPAGEVALFNVISDRELTAVPDADARAQINGISNAIDIDGRTTNIQYLEMVKRAREAEATGGADPVRLRAFDIHIQDVSRRTADKPAFYDVSLDRGNARIQDGAARALIANTGGIAETIYSSANFNGNTTNGQYQKLVRNAYESELNSSPPKAEKLRAYELYLQDLASRNAAEPAIHSVNNDIGRPAPTSDQKQLASQEITKTELAAVIKVDNFASNAEYLNALIHVQEKERTKPGSPDVARIEAADALVVKWRKIVDGDARNRVQGNPTGYAYIEHCRDAGVHMPDYASVEMAKDEALESLREAADKNPGGYTNKNCLDDMRRARDAAMNSTEPDDLAKVMAYDSLMAGDKENNIPGWETIAKKDADVPARDGLYKASGKGIPPVIPTTAEQRAILESARDNINIQGPRDVSAALKSWMEQERADGKLTPGKEAAYNRLIERLKNTNRKPLKLIEETLRTLPDVLTPSAAPTIDPYQKMVSDIKEKYLKDGRALGIPMFSKTEGWQALKFQIEQDCAVQEKATNGNPEYIAALKDVAAYCAAEHAIGTRSPHETLAEIYDPFGKERSRILTDLKSDPVLLNDPIDPLNDNDPKSFDKVRAQLLIQINAITDAPTKQYMMEEVYKKFTQAIATDFPVTQIAAIEKDKPGSIEAPNFTQQVTLEYLWNNKVERARYAKVLADHLRLGTSAPSTPPPIDLTVNDILCRTAVADHFDNMIANTTNQSEITQLTNIRNAVVAGKAPETVLYAQAGLSTDPANDFRTREITLHSRQNERCRVSPSGGLAGGAGVDIDGKPLSLPQLIDLAVAELEEAKTRDPSRIPDIEKEQRALGDLRTELTGTSSGPKQGGQGKGANQPSKKAKAAMEATDRVIHAVATNNHAALSDALHPTKSGGRAGALLIVARFLAGLAL